MGLLGAEPRERGVSDRAALRDLYTRSLATLADIRYDLSQLEVRPAAQDGEVVVQGRYREYELPSRSARRAGRTRGEVRGGRSRARVRRSRAGRGRGRVCPASAGL